MKPSAIPFTPAAAAGALHRFDALIREAEALGPSLPADQIPEALGALERAKGRLMLSALTTRGAAPPSAEDRLLTVAEAAERLSISEGELYRRASSLPFTVRQGRSVRFSTRGIEAYIRAQEGRG